MASVSKREWTHDGEAKSAWIVRHVDHAGVHRQKTFPRKKEADTYAHKVEVAVRAGAPAETAPPIRIDTACEDFLRRQEDRFRDGRIGRGRLEQLKTAVDVSIIPQLGRRTLADLRASDVEDFYAHMSRVGARRGKLAPSTAMSRITALNMVVAHAVKRGHVAKNVVPDAVRELRGIPRPIIRTFTLDEMHRLLATVESRGFRCQERPHQLARCAVYLAAFCGLRLGEVLGLTLPDLDLDKRIIRVRHSLTIWDELKAPKTAAGVRDVPMPPPLVAALRLWLARFYVENERGLVFRTREGRQVLHSIFNLTHWHGLLKRAGLYREGGDQFHFHALRHFAASWMIQNGLPLPDVASLLGHKKFDMTLQIYAHGIVGGTRRAEVMDGMTRTLLSGPNGGAPSFSGI